MLRKITQAAFGCALLLAGAGWVGWNWLDEEMRKAIGQGPEETIEEFMERRREEASALWRKDVERETRRRADQTQR